MRKQSHSIRERLSDRLFDTGGVSESNTRFDQTHKPSFKSSVRVTQHKDYYDINIPVHGYHPNDLSVSVQDRLLSVEGKANASHVEREEGMSHELYQATSFLRTFEVQENVDPKRIEAFHYQENLIIRLHDRKVMFSFAPARIQIRIQECKPA